MLRHRRAADRYDRLVSAIDERRLRAEAAYWKHVARARDDLAVFIELCARDEHGDPVQMHQIHRAWIWHIAYCWSHGKHAQIRAPFGSGKTSFLVGLAAFLVGQNRQSRIKVVCAGDDNAKQRVRSIKELIQSVGYQQVFPHIRPGKKWDVHEAFVQREGNAVDPTLHARGVMSRGIGGRADFLFLDDICDQLNSEEASSRLKVKRFSRQTWLSRLDGDSAHAAMWCTPWAPDDASDDLMNDPKWCTLVQRVAPDFESYEQEVVNAGEDYLDGMPGLA